MSSAVSARGVTICGHVLRTALCLAREDRLSLAEDLECAQCSKFAVVRRPTRSPPSLAPAPRRRRHKDRHQKAVQAVLKQQLLRLQADAALAGLPLSAEDTEARPSPLKLAPATRARDEIVVRRMFSAKGSSQRLAGSSFLSMMVR